VTERANDVDLGMLPGFLWGASTAAHQIEGNNVSSDLWELERRGVFPEPSRDACDSYHRWPEDLDLVRDLGLNAYRFSVEWARIEPEQGWVSNAELEHYRRMIAGCHDRGIEPVVTLHHFTCPRWFSREGGWGQPNAVDAFGRYVEAVSALLDGVRWVVTINEPNVVATFGRRTRRTGEAGDVPDPTPVTPDEAVGHVLVAAHRRAREIVKARSSADVGWSVATQAFVCRPGAEATFREWNRLWEDLYLEPASSDDFLGVQAYTSRHVGPEGAERVPEDEPVSLMGWALRPEALGMGLRRAWDVAGGTPLLVTENGVATEDDTVRIWHTAEALRSMKAAMDDGVSVLGYLHWSLLDNYEWGSYRPTFGLVAVDRSTFSRTPKPSGQWLGNLARRSTAAADRQD
jgi:beta-glucosidase